MIIDPHVHLRDWDQSEKETIYHGLETAYMAGVSGVFDMPNTAPPLMSRERLRSRLETAREAAAEFERIHRQPAPLYAVYGGLSAEEGQIARMIEAVQGPDPLAVGLKLFAGRSTGPLAICSEKEQQGVYRALSKNGYHGLVAVHCEKEAAFRPELWDPRDPASHSATRPEGAELASIRDQVAFARAEGFHGKLHICHVSSPDSIAYIRALRQEYKRGDLPFSITCGATPHHLLMDLQSLPPGRDGLLFKVNPPLREESSRLALFKALCSGDIDCIESDHAPHTNRDTYQGYASGIPSLCAWPILLQHLRSVGVKEEIIEKITFKNVLSLYNLDSNKLPEYANLGKTEEDYRDLAGRYEANSWTLYLKGTS